MFAKEVFHIDREGWAMFTDATGGLNLGTLRNVDGKYQIENIWTSCIDTQSNRDKLFGVWKANSFSREIKTR